MDMSEADIFVSLSEVSETWRGWQGEELKIITIIITIH